MEQLNYNLLFRWFVGLSVDDPVWVPTVFSKTGTACWRVTSRLNSWLRCCLHLPRVKVLLPVEHFSVDETLLQAWASMKSQRRKDGAAAFVAAARKLNVTTHVAQNIDAHRGSNIDARTTRHAGHRASLVIRKHIEEANSWIKEAAGMAQTKHHGLHRAGWMFTFKAAAYNLIRRPKRLPAG